jgi:hypothetical protein
MIGYSESFNKIDVFYNGKHIGYITREAGYHYYFMYYENGLDAQILSEDVFMSKHKLEKILSKWKLIF